MAMLNNQRVKLINGLTMVYGRYNYSIHRVYKPTFTSLGGTILYEYGRVLKEYKPGVYESVDTRNTYPQLIQT